MRSQAFASVCLFGTDNNSSISGVWVWRGQDLAFEVCTVYRRALCYPRSKAIVAICYQLQQGEGNYIFHNIRFSEFFALERSYEYYGTFERCKLNFE